MRVSQPFTSLLSNITIDTDLDMDDENIIVGANQVIFTDSILKRLGSGGLAIMNTGSTAYKDLYIEDAQMSGGIFLGATGKVIAAGNVDARNYLLQARDSGVGLVEVARVQGAADPYFQATLPMVLNPSSEPGTPVEGHFWYDAIADKLKYRDASATKTLLTGQVDVGTYIGNDADDRQITTGFVPSIVLVSPRTDGYGAAVIFAGSAMVWLSNDANITTTAIPFHATDGFTVDNTTLYLNANTIVYDYWAFKV